jgi:hypothetical protein
MSKKRKSLLHHLHDYFLPHRRNNYRPYLFNVTSVAVLVCAIIVFEAGYLVQTKIVFFNTNFLASVLPGVLADLTNQSRAENGIAPVAHDALLDTAAQAAANDMATKGYFAHVSPDGKTPWYWLDQAGYHYSYAGENLAVNFTDSSNVEAAWMNSPTHRSNIVKPQYTRVGFGTANGMYEGKNTTFVVEFFATPTVKTVAATSVAPASGLPKGSKPSVVQQESPIKVLGSQTSSQPALLTVSIEPVATTGWFISLLASPLNTLETIFTVLFTFIASLFTIAILVPIFVRGRVQRPSVVFSGALLLVVIFGAMLLSTMFAGPVLLPTDSQAASVYMALP